MKPKTLTFYERLSLINQFEILAELKEAENKDFQYKADILKRGYTGLYDEIFGIDEEKPEELTNEVREILSMYRHIDNSIPALSEKDRNILDLNSIAFQGFDGHEDHYMVMELLRSNGGWEELDNKPLDSHGRKETIRKYKKMLEVYNTFDNRLHLTKEQLSSLINAVM